MFKLILLIAVLLCMINTAFSPDISFATRFIVILSVLLILKTVQVRTVMNDKNEKSLEIEWGFFRYLRQKEKEKENENHE